MAPPGLDCRSAVVGVRSIEDRAVPVARVRWSARCWTEDRAALGRLDVGSVSSLWRSAAATGPSLFPCSRLRNFRVPQSSLLVIPRPSSPFTRSRPFIQDVVINIIDCGLSVSSVEDEAPELSSC